MSVPEVKARPARPEIVTRDVPRARPAWIEVATSTDHKVVGMRFIATALSFGVLALCELVLMRLQLIVPDNTMLTYTIFDRLLSAYGVTAIVLFALPLAIGFANYVVPLQIGARSSALPRLSSLAWWLYLAGGLTIYLSFLYKPSEAGMIPFPPLSDIIAYSPTNGVDAWVGGTVLAVAGLLCASINLIVTIARMRAPGMAWRRLPLFSFSSAVISLQLLVAGPVLIAALAMLFYDRNFHGVFYVSGERGAPILFQHLSYFFFTTAYLALVIFASGVISEILPTLARKPIFSHRAVARSMAAAALIGFFAWIQNMYTAQIPIAVEYIAMFFAVALLVPLGVIVFNWIATLWRGSLELRAPLLFALGAISTMTVGLAGELAYSVVAVGWQLDFTAASWQDTHYALIGASVFGGFAALYYWFPKMTGRAMSEGLARKSFWTLFLSIQVFLVPLFFAGLKGQPSDISEYLGGVGLSGWNLVATIGCLGVALGMLLTLVNAVRSVRHGTRPGPDPWGGSTLEWFALSPPPPHNFDAIPDVRSSEPFADIRRAIAERPPAPSATSLEPEQPEPQPVPDPAAPGLEAEDVAGSDVSSGQDSGEGASAPAAGSDVGPEEGSDVDPEEGFGDPGEGDTPVA